MNAEADRIRLAKAMGWIHTIGYSENPISGKRPFEKWSKRGGDIYDYLPFDPFTDANDDYAVLEWIRKDGCIPVSFYEKKQFHYRIGDYARTALEELDER